VRLAPKAGFDWAKLAWGRPDSPPSVLCSYCSTSLGERDIPMRMWNPEGYTVALCGKCATEWFGFQRE
jgi:hypothetical protein